jgi:hypothetical protein
MAMAAKKVQHSQQNSQLPKDLEQRDFLISQALDGDSARSIWQIIVLHDAT